VAMKEQLEMLARLQEIDDQLAMLERSKGDYPQRIEELEATLNLKSGTIAEARERKAELDKERRHLERHVQERQDQLGKLQGRLSAVKTNKEWDALQKEMDAVKEEIGTGEDHLLEIMDELETLDEATETEGQELDDYRSGAETEIADLKEKLSTVDVKMSRIRSERDALTPRIEDSLKRIYNRVKAGKQGTAVVPVVRGACGGCYASIPPQTVTEIRRAERPITCENCGRIIVWFGEEAEG